MGCGTINTSESLKMFQAWFLCSHLIGTHPFAGQGNRFSQVGKTIRAGSLRKTFRFLLEKLSSQLVNLSGSQTLMKPKIS